MTSVAPPAGAHGGDGARLARALGVRPDAVLDLSASLNPLAPDPGPGAGPAPRRHRPLSRPGPGPGGAGRCDGRRGRSAAAHQRRRRGHRPGGGRARRRLGRRARSSPSTAAICPSSTRRRAMAVQPAQPERAAGRARRNRGGVGRGLLAARHRHLDEGGRRDRGRRGRIVDQAAGLPRAAGRLRADSHRRHGRPPGAAPTPVGPQRAGGRRPPRTARHRRPPVLGGRNGPPPPRPGRHPSGRRLPPAPSQANWVLVRAPGLREQLAAAAICVRDCASFGLPGTVRIAVPDPAGLLRLRRAL